MIAQLHQTPDGQAIEIRCPACNAPHCVPVGTTNGWAWNGDLTAPTLEPSLLIRGGSAGVVCHSFIRAGRIEYLPDSNHALAGQTVLLPDLSPA